MRQDRQGPAARCERARSTCLRCFCVCCWQCLLRALVHRLPAPPRTAGVLDAAAEAFPPPVFLSVVEWLLLKCRKKSGADSIRLDDVLTHAFALQTCSVPPVFGVSGAPAAAFQRLLWPRQRTMAELENYRGYDYGNTLSDLDPSELACRWFCAVPGARTNLTLPVLAPPCTAGRAAAGGGGRVCAGERGGARGGAAGVH